MPTPSKWPDLRLRMPLGWSRTFAGKMPGGGGQPKKLLWCSRTRRAEVARSTSARCGRCSGVRKEQEPGNNDATSATVPALLGAAPLTELTAAPRLRPLPARPLRRLRTCCWRARSQRDCAGTTTARAGCSSSSACTRTRRPPPPTRARRGLADRTLGRHAARRGLPRAGAAVPARRRPCGRAAAPAARAVASTC